MRDRVREREKERESFRHLTWEIEWSVSYFTLIYNSTQEDSTQLPIFHHKYSFTSRTNFTSSHWRTHSLKLRLYYDRGKNKHCHTASVRSATNHILRSTTHYTYRYCISLPLCPVYQSQEKVGAGGGGRGDLRGGGGGGGLGVVPTATRHVTIGWQRHEATRAWVDWGYSCSRWLPVCQSRLSLTGLRDVFQWLARARVKCTDRRDTVLELWLTALTYFSRLSARWRARERALSSFFNCGSYVMSCVYFGVIVFSETVSNFNRRLTSVMD